MGCGKTTCPDFIVPASDSGSGDSLPSVGFLQVTTDLFTREELQRIRDRARRLSIPTSAHKTEEEWQYKKIADAANILDALYARDEQELAAIGDVTVVPTPPNVPYDSCSPTHRHSSCHHRPFLGGYRKS